MRTYKLKHVAWNNYL